MQAHLPPGETARLEALQRYRILDTPRESDFDDLVRLAAQICQTPISLVSLVDRDRQWFKGRYGLELAETPRRLSFCAHSILQAPAMTEVPDATRDPRFADNELVTGAPGMRFYAGAPLVTPEGHALGTLCVIDTKPRQLTPQQQEALRVLSRQVMTQLELRRSLAELERAHQESCAAHREESTRLETAVRESTAELVRANAQLRQSEERLRLFIEHAPVAIAVFDREMRYLAYSHRWQEHYAPNVPDLRGKGHYELWPDLPQRWKQAHQRGLAGEVVSCDEDLHEGRDGLLHWTRWEVRPWRNLDGSVGGVVVLTEDITERRRMQDALKQSEERFRTMADAIPQLAWIATPDGHITWYNRRFYEYTGVRPGEKLGWEWQSLHDPRVLPRVLEHWNHSLATGEPFNMELSLRAADGQLHPFLTRVMPLKGAHGQVLHWFGTSTDIREIVAAREALARSREELERLVRERTAQLVEANANLQNFAYTAAHDLRSPLRAIHSFTGLALAQSGERLDAMGRSLLERAVGSAEQMDSLLNDLLEYSRIAQKDLRLEKVKLEAAVREALGLLEGDIRAKQAGVRVEPPLPEVIGHPATVVMLITNLVSNGLKFVATGVQPQLRIWAETRNPHPLNSQPSTPNSFVRLWVQDNGIGIAPDDQPKVFGAFQRLHGKGAYPGTGLGLAIVRKGAERMGGRVGLESEPGRGSRFWIELRSAH